jgi:hypothetical protein
VEVDEGGQAVDDKGMEDATQDNSEPEVAVKDQQVQERRRSEILKKDTSLTTMEKTEIAGAKKNLEGNSLKSNSFAVLSIEEIIHTTSEMGVMLDVNDLATFDLLDDLETARNDLYQKQNGTKPDLSN